MRPLYIDGFPGCRVVLDDPALRIVVPEKADQLFPLSRISRVVCKGVVEWSMSALLACADAGITLLFLNANGEVRARWLGQCGNRQSLSQRLVDLLARSDGLALYENWYASMEKLVARSLARRSGIVDWRLVSIQELRLHFVLEFSTTDRLRANLLESLLQSELMIMLPNFGFSNDDEALIAGPVDLVRDLSRLLVWDFYPALMAWHNPEGLPDVKAIAQLFQAQEDRMYLLAKSSLNKLHQFLLTVS